MTAQKTKVYRSLRGPHGVGKVLGKNKWVHASALPALSAKERVFGGEVFELWTGEYGPDPGGHTKAQAQKYAGDLRRLGSYARVVQYGRKYFVYFR